MAAELRRRAAWEALVRTFKPGSPGLARRLGAVPRMVAASARGEYDGRARLALLLASAAYIVSPIDLVPEGFLLRKSGGKSGDYRAEDFTE